MKNVVGINWSSITMRLLLSLSRNIVGSVYRNGK